MVILGPQSLENLRAKEMYKINQIISLGRMVISKYKYGPTRNIMEIYESDCFLRKVWN